MCAYAHAHMKMLEYSMHLNPILGVSYQVSHISVKVQYASEFTFETTHTCEYVLEYTHTHP